MIPKLDEPEPKRYKRYNLNTVTRIEGLNKFLRTWMLVSEDIVSQLNIFLTRKVGEFLFVGKVEPIVVHELICSLDESDAQKRELCTAFDEALETFKRRAWKKAKKLFHDIIMTYEVDGSSNFYIRLCEKHSKNPPEEKWKE